MAYIRVFVVKRYNVDKNVDTVHLLQYKIDQNQVL